MSFALVTTQHFERRTRKFLRKHPDLRPALRDTLDDLSRDPFQPQLKLHPLSGNLVGVQAVSLTYSYRLTLLVRVTEREIVLLDIGTHSLRRTKTALIYRLMRTKQHHAASDMPVLIEITAKTPAALRRQGAITRYQQALEEALADHPLGAA